MRIADINPLKHFVKFGWKEGRNPSENFDIRYYLDLNPDIQAAKVNPLVHYVRIGKKEGRSAFAYVIEDKSVIIPSPDFYNLSKQSTGIIVSEENLSRLPIFFEDQIKLYDEKVSVIIPTKNAGRDFELLLKNLKGQKGFKSIELMIVDSGSQDNTIAIAEDYGVKILSILPEEFSHSYARNVGIENATGDYFLFTVQDALPPSNTWLYELFTVLKTNEVVAVSCAETPREDADLFYRVISWNHYNFLDVNDKDRIFKLPEAPDYVKIRQNGQLSDVACLIDSRISKKYKYRLDYAEDLDLGIRLIKDGHKIAFLGTTRIIHSHNRPAYYFLKRGYVDNLFLSEMFSDFVTPKINIEDLVTDVAFVYQYLNEIIKEKLLSIKFPVTTTIFETTLREAFDLADKQTYPGELSKQNDDFMDNRFIGFIEDFVDPLGFLNSGKQYSGFLVNALMGFITLTINYLNNSYEIIDDKLVNEIMGCIYKEFAIVVGSRLAYCYINKLTDDNVELEKMHTTLKEGI